MSDKQEIKKDVQNNNLNEKGKKKVENKSKIKVSKLVIISAIMAIVIVIIISILGWLLYKKINTVYEQEGDIKMYQSEINELKVEITGKKSKIEELEKKVKELSQEDKIKELEDKVKGLETNVSDLETKKNNLEGDIEKLKADVITTKGEPKKYPAGQLVAGSDLPTGKYKISGGNSNFIVHSSSGSLMVNIILGGGSYGVDEYIYTFKSGDKIDARSSFTLQEVE